MKFGDAILVIVPGVRTNKGSTPSRLVSGSFLKMMNDTTVAYLVENKVVKYCDINLVVDQAK